MKYYALTLRGTTITGIHEGTKPFDSKTFAKNPRLAADEVLPVQSSAEYEHGTNIQAYEKGGRLKPLLWRIQNGFAEQPPDTEIVNGELVKIDVPESETPALIKDILQNMRDEIKALNDRFTEQAAKIASIESKVNPSIIEPIKEEQK